MKSLIAFATLVSLTSFAAAQSCPINVSRQQSNSWLILNTRIHNVFWGNFWTGDSRGIGMRPAVDSAWQNLASQQAFWTRLVEYGMGPYGSFGSSHVFDVAMVDPVNANIDEESIRVELRNELNSGALPYAADYNDLYVIYLPAGVMDANSPVGGAHHDWTTDYWGRPIWYAVIQFQTTLDGMTRLASHEIVEAATDPAGTGYYQGSDGKEIGDICETDVWSTDSFRWSPGNFLVQKMWSQETCQCVNETIPVVVDPCNRLPPAQRLCCHKPWLPVCNDPG